MPSGMSSGPSATGAFGARRWTSRAVGEVTVVDVDDTRGEVPIESNGNDVP